MSFVLTLLRALALLWCVALLSVKGETFYKVNCGGVLGSHGWNVADGWEADDAYLISRGRALTRSRFAFRSPDNLFYFQTERSDEGSDPLEYDFPVMNGNYKVELYLTEVQHAAQGLRLMDIYVEDMGLPVETAYDIFRESGDAQLVPLIVPYTISVADGNGLQIKLQAIVDNAKVNAIVISTADEEGPATESPTTLVTLPPTYSPTSSPLSPTPAPAAGDDLYKINCGGTFGANGWIAAEGWEADDAYLTGPGEAVTRARFVFRNPENLFYFQTERMDVGTDPLEYNFPLLPNGNYVVKLYLTEVQKSARGERLMDIFLEDMVTPVATDFDIFEASGDARLIPLIVQYTVPVADGNGLQIRLQATVDNAKINGIVISEAAGGPPATDLPTWAPTASPTEIPTTSPTEVPAASPTDSPVTEPPVNGPAIRINCGGIDFTDSQNNAWINDRTTDYRVLGVRRNGDLDYPVPEADQPLYDARGEGTVLRYEVDVSSIDLNSGAFNVELSFVEHSGDRTAGVRVFDIFVQDTLVWDDFDIYVEAGNARLVPVVVDFDMVVPSGPLTIELQAVSDVAVLSGIVIRPAEPVTSSPTMSPSSWGDGVTAEPTSNGEGFVLRLNVGGPDVVDQYNNLWEKDNSFVRRPNGTLTTTEPINGADLETLYQTARYGWDMRFRIPVPPGDYNVKFHFAEIDENVGIGERIFDIRAEEPIVVAGADITATVGQFAALVETRYVPAVDSLLAIQMFMVEGSTYQPLISALEIIQIVPHLAHSVPGGPYMGVARDNMATASVPVNGIESHTHEPGAEVVSWKWFLDDSLIGDGAMVDLNLPVGTHTVTLDVEDSAGHTNSETTTVLVRPTGFPFIDSMTPDNGQMDDTNYSITLTGVGFLAANLVVHFGPVDLYGDGSEITIVSDTELILNAAIPSVRTTTGPVFIYLETDIGASNTLSFTQYDEPFFFDTIEIIDGVTLQPYYIFQPTSLAFGPDEKLYVGTRDGELHKLTLDENWVVTEAVVSTAVSDQSRMEDRRPRAILGMAFDPLDTSDTPTLYITSSILSHQESVAWEGRAINGRVVAVTGENMDTLTNVITGLPLLDRDHSVNGIEFGNNGELYINNGGNTNAGIPGPLSSTQVQEEGYLSAACNVAYLNRETFDGHVTYDDLGNKVGGTDVEVFASGTRNPYDLVLHSNGFLYGTDNGPNIVYGPESVDCVTEGDPEPAADDELNLLERDNYYGHPNRKRGEVDPRQCTYHHPDEGSGDGFTGPMATIPSSVDGITEFKSNHFGGSMRGQLVIGQFKGAMYRVPLTPDGRGIVNDEVILFLQFGGLDVTQAPDGSIVAVRYTEHRLLVNKPRENPVSDLEIKSVFPYRGHLDGGSTLNIYGVNMDTGSVPTVTVGGDACTSVVVVSSTKLSCTIPAKPRPGTADVVVDNGLVNERFTDAYRYITGEE